MDKREIIRLKRLLLRQNCRNIPPLYESIKIQLKKVFKLLKYTKNHQLLCQIFRLLGPRVLHPSNFDIILGGDHHYEALRYLKLCYEEQSFFCVESISYFLRNFFYGRSLSEHFQQELLGTLTYVFRRFGLDFHNIYLTYYFLYTYPHNTLVFHQNGYFLKLSTVLRLYCTDIRRKTTGIYTTNTTNTTNTSLIYTPLSLESIVFDPKAHVDNNLVSCILHQYVLLDQDLCIEYMDVICGFLSHAHLDVRILCLVVVNKNQIHELEKKIQRMWLSQKKNSWVLEIILTMNLQSSIPLEQHYALIIIYSFLKREGFPWHNLWLHVSIINNVCSGVKNVTINGFNGNLGDGFVFNNSNVRIHRDSNICEIVHNNALLVQKIFIYYMDHKHELLEPYWYHYNVKSHIRKNRTLFLYLFRQRELFHNTLQNLCLNFLENEDVF